MSLRTKFYCKYNTLESNCVLIEKRKFNKSYMNARFLLSRFIILLFTVVYVSCGENSNPGDPGPTGDKIPVNNSGVDCNKTVEYFIKDLDRDINSIPSWEQIDCYTENLVRKPYPSTVIMVAERPPAEDGPVNNFGVWDFLQKQTAYLKTWPQNEVSGLAMFPPFLSTDGTSSFYRESAERWDEKMRANALNAIWVKQQGYRVRITNFYPPSYFDQPNWWKLHAQNVNSAETFLNWWCTEYIPERKELAKLAERIKAEILMPWDIEPGHFVRAFGDAWLSSLSESEQISLVQTMIDELAAALRPLFSGTLSIIIYDSYAAFGQHWDQINVSAWDQANFVFFTQGNLEFTEQYLDRQLEGYMKIIQRSNIPWIAQEVTVDGNNHRRLLSQGETFEAIEEDIYRMIFKKLSEQPVKPVGIGITTGYIETPGAESYVRSALSNVAAGGF